MAATDDDDVELICGTRHGGECRFRNPESQNTPTRIVSRETQKALYHNILFHVKHGTLFTDTKISEDDIQHILHPDTSGDSTQCASGQPEVLGFEIILIDRQGSFQ